MHRRGHGSDRDPRALGSAQRGAKTRGGARTVKNFLLCAALIAGALCGALARADFSAALKDYNAAHYEQAQARFLALAELGDCSSQFNLGAMALKGQGGPKDRAAGAGWLEAAAGNGCQQLVGARLTALRSGLSAEEARTAAAIVAR